MRAVPGILLSAVLLAGCVPPPAAPVKPAPSPAPVMIGTPTSEVITPALKALQQAATDSQLLLRFTVQPDGSVANPQIRFTRLPATETATVLTAFQQWRFKPAEVQGKPVARDFIYPMFFGPNAASQRTVFMCRNQASVYEPAQRCKIVVLGDWRIYQRDPVYPPGLLSQGMSGSVTLNFDIGADGWAKNPKVISATPPQVFNAAAIAAVKGWYFERLDGKPVDDGEDHQQVTVTVHLAPPTDHSPQANKKYGSM